MLAARPLVRNVIAQMCYANKILNHRNNCTRFFVFIAFATYGSMFIDYSFDLTQRKIQMIGREGKK